MPQHRAVAAIVVVVACAACSSFGEATPEGKPADAGPLGDASSTDGGGAGDGSTTRPNPSLAPPEKIGTSTAYLDPAGIAVDATSLYIAVQGAGAIVARSKAGAADLGASVISGLKRPEYLTLAGSDLYWTESGGGRIASGKSSGGGATTVATPAVSMIGIAVDGSTLFATAYNADGPLFRGSAMGGEFTEVKRWPEEYPEGIALHGRTLYVALFHGHRIVALNVDTLDERAVATVAAGPAGIAADEHAIWFTTQGPPGVHRLWHGDANAASVAPATGLPIGITTDAEYVYWVIQDSTAGTLWRKKKYE